MTQFITLDGAKRALRAEALACRAACDPALGAELATHLLAAAPPPPGAAIGGYWAIRGEIDVMPLLRALHAAGHPVLLPETPPPGEALRFRAWQPGAPMVRGRFGTLHPAGEAGRPDWLLVPLVAFDRRGARLGYGAGYYDRTLAGLPGARAIGCAFAAQEVESVPAGPHDMRLEAVATERGVIWCGGGSLADPGPG